MAATAARTTDGKLDAAWRAQAAVEVETLRKEASAADEAHTAVATAEKALRALLQRPPPSIVAAGEAGLDLEVLTTTWQTWHTGTELVGGKLATHVEDCVLSLHGAIEAAQAQAAALVAEREDAWRPVAMRLLQWLPGARQLLADAQVSENLKAAETWLRETGLSLRNDRFEPIKDQFVCLPS